jgi:uncharacterized protein (DUF1810 family)
MGRRFLSAILVGIIVAAGGFSYVVLGSGLKPGGAGVTLLFSLIFGFIAAVATFIFNDDPLDLGRFVLAQEKTYAGALAELTSGAKTGHWIWWIFPQLKGLGMSERSTFYGLADDDEASAYLRHPLLGARYRECVAVVHGHLCEGGVAPLTMMGSEVDVLKLRSSLKLFLGVASPTDDTFRGQAQAILKVLG